MVELLRPLDHFHAATSKNVGRSQEHRIADPLRHPLSLVATARDAVGRLFEAEALDQRSKPLAVLRKVDAVGRSPEDRNACGLQLFGKLQRRLTAELDDDAQEVALLLLAKNDLKYVLGCQWLKIEPIGCVGVGRDR